MVVNLSQNNSMSYFGKKLRSRLRECAIEQKDLAFDLRVDSGLISKVLNGKLGASHSLMMKLASYAPLKLTYNQLRVWQLLNEVEPDDVPYLKDEVAKL